MALTRHHIAQPDLFFLGALPSCGSASDRPEASTACYRWLIHFSDRSPLEVAFSPEASHVEVLELYPAAVAAAPCDPASDTGPDTYRPGAQRKHGSSYGVSFTGNANPDSPLDEKHSQRGL